MSSTATDRVRIDVRLGPEDLADQLERDVRAGLSASPRQLPPKWFYDERGSQLFDAITRLPEYYPTETERAILRSRADDLVQASGADTLVELGSGTSDKTGVLLDAMNETGQLTRYVPFDVSEETLRGASHRLAERYDGLEIEGVVGDLDHDLDAIPRDGRRLVAFLGGTIGNYPPGPRSRLLGDLAGTLDPGDHLLLGTDLVKDTQRLLDAYDDSQGVTADFNRNVLAVVNRRLDADFDLDAYEHVAVWDDENAWIEMRLRSDRDQAVRIEALDMELALVRDEEILTEISAKFTQPALDAELTDAGLELVDWWTDDNGDFALSLARLEQPPLR
jgi:L-histidine N-alpha-methyltransferase